jgi:hypothetical protein
MILAEMSISTVPMYFENVGHWSRDAENGIPKIQRLYPCVYVRSVLLGFQGTTYIRMRKQYILHLYILHFF